MNTRLVNNDGIRISYAVEFEARLLTARTRFFIRKNERWKRVFQPYTATMELPNGWSFSPHHLYLGYEALDSDLRSRSRAFIRRVTVDQAGLALEGALISADPIEAFRLEMRKFREEAIGWEFFVPTHPAKRVWGIVAEAYRRYRGEYAYKFSASLKLRWEDVRSSIYSLIVHTESYTTAFHRFSGSFDKKRNLFGVHSGSVFSFIDRNAGILRIEKYSFTKEDWPRLQEKARSSTTKKVIVIGEYTNSARDNSLHLFRYLHDVPDIEAYYVIEKNCGLVGQNIIEFGSAEHVERCLEASVVAFTHHPGYVVTHLADALRVGEPVKKVFLQHGVTAFKNSMDAYVVGKTGFDLFNVCSTREKNTVVQACNYPADRVVVCGFPRHDELFQRAALAAGGPRNTILVFPTWRRSLDKTTPQGFMETEFYRNWARLCTLLRSRGRALGWKIVFVTHPIIARHEQLFEEHVDEITSVEDVQSQIVSCGCLVTDYSSIAIDAVFVRRPVYFFTFDAEAYGFKEGAFVNVDKDLPGERRASAEELADLIERSWSLRASLDPRFERKLPLYFDYIDDRNRERIEAAIRRVAGW